MKKEKKGVEEHGEVQQEEKKAKEVKVAKN